MKDRVALALGAALALATACAPKAPPPSGVGAHVATPAASPTNIPIAVVGHRRGKDPIRLTELKRGRVLYTLSTDVLRGHYAGPDTGTSDLTNPHITFYGEKGKRLIASAPAGTVVEKDKTVRMNGGVHARSQDGMTLRSDSLRYEDATEIVHGVGHVVITSPSGERLEGDTVVWNLRSGNIEMNMSTP